MSGLSPADQRNLFGYAWDEGWVGPYEGTMTLILKFSWANAFNAREVSSALFNTRLPDNRSAHSRTFLALEWVIGTRTLDTASLIDIIVSSGLNHYTPQWFQYIASDARLRFCPTCMDFGYQSIFFQIDALSHCPIHGDEIYAACRFCGTPTPHYSLSSAALTEPFHCAKCGTFYGNRFDPNMWSEHSLHKCARDLLAPIAFWLDRLNRAQLAWHQWREWYGPWLSDELLEFKRIATFAILKTIVPLEFPENLLNIPNDLSTVRCSTVTNNSCQILAPSAGQNFTNRRNIYKSIRRHLIKCANWHGHRCATTTFSSVQVSWGEEVFYLSRDKCPYAQSIVVWRLRFEEARCVTAKPNVRHDLQLRLTVLNFPSHAVADDKAWATYALMSFNAVMQVVQNWWQKALTIRDPHVLGADRATAMALYSEFAPLLSPTRFPVPFRITTIIDRGQDGVENALHVIGPGRTDVRLPACPIADPTRGYSSRLISNRIPIIRD